MSAYKRSVQVTITPLGETEDARHESARRQIEDALHRHRGRLASMSPDPSAEPDAIIRTEWDDARSYAKTGTPFTIHVEIPA